MVTNEELFKQMADAVIDGDDENCVALAKQVVGQGIDPLEAIQNGFNRGMQTVGEKFATLEYYLPDVMQSANAVGAGMKVLQPYLLERGDVSSAGTVVLGTIKGDIHDLGKNIVGTMLEAAGFTVHDLGCDTPVRQFVDRAKEAKADIIAVSAMLTTTMLYMADLVALLEELGLREKYKLMVGGAPITADWAATIGADGYGETASEAVEVAKRLMQEKKGRDQ